MKRWKRIFRNVAVVFLSTGTILSVPVIACAHVEETAEEAHAEQEGNLGNTTLQSEKEETVPEQKAGSEEEQTGENQKKDVNAFSTAGNGQVQDTVMILNILQDSKIKNQENEDVEINLNKMMEKMMDDFTIDYTFKYKWKSGDEKEYIIQIPYKSSDNFENGYQHHDLQLGKLSLIGIYRGEVNFSQRESITKISC